MLLLQPRPAVSLLHFSFCVSFTAVLWLGLQDTMERPEQSLKKTEPNHMKCWKSNQSSEGFVPVNLKSDAAKLYVYCSFTSVYGSVRIVDNLSYQIYF